MSEIKHGHDENPEVHHETSDINARGILWFIAIFIVFAVVVHVALGVFYWWLEKENHESQPAPVTLVRGGQKPLAEPRLQPFPRSLPPYPGASARDAIAQTPAVEMKEFREGEEARLNSYGWADRRTGTVHIPIEKAFEIELANGFPVRQQTAAAVAEHSDVRLDDGSPQSGAEQGTEAEHRNVRPLQAPPTGAEPRNVRPLQSPPTVPRLP